MTSLALVKTLEMLELSKESGRLVIAPIHLLELYVPLENIEEFANTIKEFDWG